MRLLYEINEDIANFEFDIDEETGEILNSDALDELNLEREQKIEGVALYYKNLCAEADMVKAEADTLTDRYKRLQRKADGLKDYLSYALKGEKFNTPKVAMSFRKSKSVHISDEHLIPDKYMNISVVKKPDKKVIKDALEKGVEVMGAEIVEKNSVQIK